MLIDINKIIVNDRIRKDFGNLEELAEDIKENGLINPPVVNKSYVLLAGERRLKACKLLGWPTIEVRMMDTRDAEHELNIEISENDVRKGFSKSERLDYIQRLYRIEQAKAKERQGEKTSDRNLTEVVRSDDATAKAFGISRDTMRRELFISDNRDLLDPADFADWDEGKLSTNKAFQRIKAAQKQAEKERDEARQEMQDVYLASENMEREVESLREQLAKRPKPEVIEREVEVVREVESQESKRRIAELERLERLHNKDYQRLRKRNEEMRKELDKARDILGMDKTMQDVRRDVQYLISSTNQYVRRYGGLTWTAESLTDVDDSTIEELRKSVRNLSTFANTLMNFLEEINGNN